MSEPSRFAQAVERWRTRVTRAPLLLLALICLVTGVWGGLTRLHWSLVPMTEQNVDWVTFHGSLMVCGFLGTLIGVERAAAMQRWWAYVGPLTTAIGGALLVAGNLGSIPPLLFVLGALCLLSITAAVWARHRPAFLFIMACGAAAWLMGNVLWLWHWPFHRVVLWWIGFLLLTIVAERIELSRFLQPTRWQRAMVLLAAAVCLGGTVTSLWLQQWGERIAGVGMIALAVWLLQYDVARRTIRKSGLARFIASCLLSGYAWLALAGLSLLLHAPLPKYGGAYDATLHAFFLGFVFSMIFGHAPIVLPAVMNVEIPFRRLFYAHLVLLHVSLVVRVVGDVGAVPRLNGWGGTLNMVALVLFLLCTIGSVIIAAASRGLAATRKQSKP
ncbi:MAG: hypothetical protein HYV60_22000 [Planctomycetia bacterium]|nr:hypothetical protein [Planctomycetia bacterium]